MPRQARPKINTPEAIAQRNAALALANTRRLAVGNLKKEIAALGKPRYRNEHHWHRRGRQGVVICALLRDPHQDAGSIHVTALITSLLTVSPRTASKMLQRNDVPERLRVRDLTQRQCYALVDALEILLAAKEDKAVKRYAQPSLVQAERMRHAA